MEEEFSPNEWNQDLDPDWFAQVNLGIREVRMLHDHLTYAIETWPGAPRRPAEEQVFLQFMKNRMFAMILDYNLTEGQ